jgi:hypothetical protein
MNERIRELAKQDRQEFLKLPTGYKPEQVGMYPQLMEKFAELIIREYSYDVMNLTSMPKHVEIAAKHWGVEL